jgi:hypothetical protein
MTRRKQKKVQSLQRAAKYMLLKYKSKNMDSTNKTEIWDESRSNGHLTSENYKLESIFKFVFSIGN